MSTQKFSRLPKIGAWRLLGAHEGYEVTRFATDAKKTLIEGTSVGMENGDPWNFSYSIELDAAWHTRRAVIKGLKGAITIAADGKGHWKINGKRQPRLDGCLDLDLESSVVTNLAPIRRMALEVGQSMEAPAAYVRFRNLGLERLEQTYQRLPDRDGRRVFDYAAPRFEYQAQLRFSLDGLVVDYPDIGIRVL